MPPTTQAYGNPYRSPPTRDVHGSGAQNKWIAWNNSYYVYDEEHLQWVNFMIWRLHEQHEAGTRAQIEGEDVWLWLGAFSALVEIFKKTKHKLIRPWIQGYLDAWDNFEVFKDMRDHANRDFRTTLYIKAKESPRILGFLLLATVLLYDPELPRSEFEILEMYHSIFIIDKYPEWSARGLGNLCFGKSLDHGYRKIGARDASQDANPGRTIIPRDGYGVHDWMYYTPTERNLFRVINTEVVVKEFIQHHMVLDHKIRLRLRNNWLVRRALTWKPRVMRVFHRRHLNKDMKKRKISPSAYIAALSTNGAENLLKMGAKPPTVAQLGSVDANPAALNESKTLTDDRSEENSDSKSPKDNELAPFDILQHPLYKTSREENLRLLAKIQELQQDKERLTGELENANNVSNELREELETVKHEGAAKVQEAEKKREINKAKAGESYNRAWNGEPESKTGRRQSRRTGRQHCPTEEAARSLRERELDLEG